MMKQMDKLTIRTKHALMSEGLTSKRQVVNFIRSHGLSLAGIRGVPFIGKKSFDEICLWAGITKAEIMEADARQKEGAKYQASIKSAISLLIKNGYKITK